MRRSNGMWMVWGLALANLGVHLLWLTVGRSSNSATQWMAEQFTISYQGLAAGHIWTLLTAAFSHADTTHFLFNMIALVSFGRAVTQVIGPWRFLHLYIAGALISSLGHVLWQILSNSPNPALGASGSVMAIAVMFAALFPKQILRINFILPLPAWLAVLLFVIVDLAGVFTGMDSGIGHAAHLGGAAYGLLYYTIRIRPYLGR